MKLLVIADDFTGALDTGVRFGAENTLIRIRSSTPRKVFDDLPEDTQVLIVDAETRHLNPRDAYSTVYEIVSAAKEAHVKCIYKKTDSALRGNIGSELAAALAASGERKLHFVPAFPYMNRVTRNGIHYINGIPVAESVFGADPFEPVRQSSVADIIAQQSDVPCIPAGENACGICIHDASTDSDLRKTASLLNERGELRLLAGCAGFAAVLPELLGISRNEASLRVNSPRLLTVCGSINPITVRQLDVGEGSGMPRIRLSPLQKFTSDWMDSPGGRSTFSRWLELFEKSGNLIIDCGETYDEAKTRQLETQLGISRGDMRRLVASAMGSILKHLLDMGVCATLLVTGGDTLLAFMDSIGVHELADICEISPGIVLSGIEYCGRRFDLISKSGGFGEEDLLPELTKKLLEKQSC